MSEIVSKLKGADKDTELTTTVAYIVTLLHMRCINEQMI